MKRFSPEAYARLRSRVESGKVPVGSSAHLALIDFDIAMGELTPRSQHAVRLAIKGWSHQLIADSLGLSRSRVSHLIADFMTSIHSGS